MKIWFQNRRTKWKKQENISSAEAAEHKLSAEKHLLKNAKNKKQAEKTAVPGAAPPPSSLAGTAAAAASAATAAAEPADASPATSSNLEATPTAMDTSAGSGAGVLCSTTARVPTSTGAGSLPFPLCPHPPRLAAPLPTPPTLTDTATSPGPVLDLSLEGGEEGEEEVEEGDHERNACHVEEGSAEEQHDVSVGAHVRQVSPVNLVVTSRGSDDQQDVAGEGDWDEEVDSHEEICRMDEAEKEPQSGGDLPDGHFAAMEDSEEDGQSAHTDML